MTDLIGAILAAVVVIVISAALWSLSPIYTVLLLVFGGALIYNKS